MLPREQWISQIQFTTAPSTVGRVGINDCSKGRVCPLGSLGQTDQFSESQSILLWLIMGLYFQPGSGLTSMSPAHWKDHWGQFI